MYISHLRNNTDNFLLNLRALADMKLQGVLRGKLMECDAVKSES